MECLHRFAFKVSGILDMRGFLGHTALTLCLIRVYTLELFCVFTLVFVFPINKDRLQICVLFLVSVLDKIHHHVKNQA